jgi:hypothetical protein
MNAHSYYPEWKSSRTQIHRLAPLIGNRLPIYKKTPSTILTISEGETKLIKVNCWDAHGNFTSCSYFLNGDIDSNVSDRSSDLPRIEIDSVKTAPAYPSSLTEIILEGVKVVWPKESFYSRETALLSVEGDRYVTIGPKDAPLAKSFKLTLDCPDELCEYWVAERLSEQGKRVGVEVCDYVGTKLEMSSSKMGIYHFVQDTVPPRVLPKHSASPLVINGDMVFHVEDALSGVAKVEGFIDDKWVLFHWDPKSKTATYRATDLQHIPGDTQTVRFISQDGVGLISEWSGKVTFP